MGVFSKYEGKRQIEVEDDGKTYKFNVRPTNRQINKIMGLDKKKRRTEEGLGEIDRVYVDILMDANPPDEGEDKEAYQANIEQFVANHKVDLQTEFAIAMGWTTREKIEKAIAAEEAKADKEEGKE